jgi:hypothetical protein
VAAAPSRHDSARQRRRRRPVRRLAADAARPDRGDFQAWGTDDEGRRRAWRRAIAESARLADEFAERVGHGAPVEALPLG